MVSAELLIFEHKLKLNTQRQNIVFIVHQSEV